MKFQVSLLGALALVCLSQGAEAANRPKGWVTICKEGASCSVAANTNVAFGRADQFIYKVLSGSFVCSAATFGSKIAGGVNECSIASAASSASSAPSSSSSSKSSSSSSTPSSSSSSTSSSSSSSATACKPGSITGTVDCGGITVGTSCDGQSESQQAVFNLADGAVLKNVHIRAGGGADGIHCQGNCTLENVVWDGVCEDAATMQGGSGKVMKVIGGSATLADDKVFQHNGKGSTINLSNFQTYQRIQRLWASCGNCSSNGGPRYFIANGVTLNGPVTKPDGTEGYVLRLNSNYGDKATVRTMRIKGYTLGHPKVCVQAIGVQPGEAQVNNGEFWNTAYCDISKTDVTSF
ncbi:MAG TPA: pectate lyase [Rhodocyclaceae bacterium]|nr:pectate lyase [Rhodocyclaceae bacterium]